MIEAGISSSDHIAKFFGLDEPQIETPAKTTKRQVSLFDAKRLCCVDRLSRHLYERTSPSTSAISEMCHKETHAPQNNISIR